MPKSNILERYLRIAAYHARQTADVFAGNRIALVRHGAGTLLSGSEKFFGLANLGALQMPDLQSNLVERGAQDCEGGDVGGMAIALQDLRRDQSGLQAQFGEDRCLVRGLEFAKGSDSTGDFAYAHIFRGGVEALQIPPHFGIPEQEFHAEGGRLGMHTVGAANGWRVLELHGAFAKNRAKPEDAITNQGRG